MPKFLASKRWLIWSVQLYIIIHIQRIRLTWKEPVKSPLNWSKCLLMGQWLSVFFAFFVDTVITVLSTIGAWNELAKGWGDLSTLTPLDWSIAGLPLLSGMGMFVLSIWDRTYVSLPVASIVHFFFAWRIWKLTRFRILPGAICVVGDIFSSLEAATSIPS